MGCFTVQLLEYIEVQISSSTSLSKGTFIADYYHWMRMFSLYAALVKRHICLLKHAFLVPLIYKSIYIQLYTVHWNDVIYIYAFSEPLSNVPVYTLMA